MSTDFFVQQDIARRKTGWLVVFFVLAVVSIILAIYLMAAFIVTAGEPLLAEAGRPVPPVRGLWNPPLFLGVSLMTLAVILAGSLYKMSELSSGGEAVALLLGGRPINPQTKDLAERRLLNVVEEMALASGTPIPPVYVLDRESSINAFAAGHQPGDAVIGVSRGCLAYLTRDELQGVMAHEFSHILNGDMRLNLRLTGTVFGILILAVLGYYMMRFAGSFRSSDKKGGGVAAGVFGIGLALMIIGYVGVFFGKLIKSAVCRQREYLADSAAVQFTRYPPGIGGALKKIGGLPETSRIRDAHAEEVSHMFFSDAFEGMFFNFFATHPPLPKRIRRIDPGFDGTFPRVAPLVETGVAADKVAAPPVPERQEEDIRRFLDKFGKGEPREKGRARAMPLNPALVMGQVGLPGAVPMVYAAAMLAALPQDLLAAAREPYSARALIYALLLGQDEAVRNRQLEYLRQRIEPPSYRETLQTASVVAQLSDEARVPLVDISYPALKRLSPDQYTAFRGHVETLVKADEKIDLFEYMIRSLLLRNLDVHFGLAKPVSPRYHAITPVRTPFAQVLSTLAYAGQETQEAAQCAFDQGTAGLSEKPPMLPKQECTLAALDEALQELAQAAPKLHRVILGGCVACIAADGKVTVKESELLRAVAGVLGCPVPPIPLQQRPVEPTP